MNQHDCFLCRDHCCRATGIHRFGWDYKFGFSQTQNSSRFIVHIRSFGDTVEIREADHTMKLKDERVMSAAD